MKPETEKTSVNFIQIRGARQHNLKNIDLDIPKNKLVVFTGVSGSGKSSLAMDTIYAEGQRRYVESLSAYARQFLGVMDKPDVDKIDGLSPAIAIDQKTTSKNPRSTVGTITEIYDYLRLLFARVGHPHCPNCGREIQRQSSDEITERILALLSQEQDFKSEKGIRYILFAPVVKDRKGEYSQLFENLKKQGILRARIDGQVMDLNQKFDLIKTNKHTIEALVTRNIHSKKKTQDAQEFTRTKGELFQNVETALRLGEGNLVLSIVRDTAFDFPLDPRDFEDHMFSENFACPVCSISLPDLEPRTFSFNSPHGACPACDGLGVQLRVDKDMVLNKSLSVSEGGVLPWSRLFEHYTWTQKVVTAVFNQYGYSLDDPIKDLPKNALELLLYGVTEKKFKINYVNAEGRHHSFEARFEGVIPNMIRRHKETESDYIRGEIEKYMINEPCEVCKGNRLKKEALSVVIKGKNICEVANLSVITFGSWIDELTEKLSEREQKIAQTIIKEIKYRVKFLVDVGLSYLTISRASGQLSGGEAQRIRLASQIGSGLSGVLYVLDEPSIGLHQHDQSKLIKTLHHLRDLGNTVIVVEHDTETMLESDYIFDFGPGAGEHGGRVVAEGTPNDIKVDKQSITGRYLSGSLVVGKNVNIGKFADIPETNMRIKKSKRKFEEGAAITLHGAAGRNLKTINVTIPLGQLVCVTGVSGSGKSTLVMDTLYQALRHAFGLKIDQKPEVYKSLVGLEYLTNVVAIDQSPIGRTPKSNPATYTKTFDHIRELFSQTQEAKLRGYGPGRFSFNVKGGRCEACGGEGQIKIEMQFMPDVYVNCEVCAGKRYNRDALEIYYKNKTISDVLEMTVDEALEFFENQPRIRNKIQTLSEVGLGYIKLGQPAPTLSGGEAQRVKLALELSKKATGGSFYILDEPTTGLHFADLENLIRIFKKLTSKGNTVLVIEHNLDVVSNSDWLIDLGPEGGDRGGELLYSGPLQGIKNVKNSYTAQALNAHNSLTNPW